MRSGIKPLSAQWIGWNEFFNNLNDENESHESESNLTTEISKYNEL